MRAAAEHDAPAGARIYNEGIEDRVATFETELRTGEDRRAAIAEARGRYPFVVAEEEGAVVGFAGGSAFSGRACYRGVVGVSVYVARSHRSRGVGRALLGAFVAEAGTMGIWQVVSGVFPGNAPSRALCRAVGFKDIGVHSKHAKLDGVWRDVVLVERLVDANLT